jgi:POT family proton-dependent oligopeptide transporter
MASVLVLYLNAHLLHPERDATTGYHAFLAAAHLASVVGGWIAERVLGRRRTVLAAASVYVVGLAVIAGWESRAGLLLGISMVVLGVGGVRPGLSAFLADRARAVDASLRRRLARALLVAVNLAAAASALLVPALLATSGPRAALALPALAMALALVVFRWRAPRHLGPAPSGPDPHGFARVIVHAVSRLGTGHPGQRWLDLARDVHPADAVDGAKAVLRTLGVLAAVTLFWALFDQRGSSWVFQARQMDLTVAGRQLSPAQLQALNPLLVLALVPLLRGVVFPLLERRGVAVPPLRKMSAGMFATALSFAAAAIVQAAIDAGGAPHALWQLPQYVLLTGGEVLVAFIGLELATARVPRAMRSTVLALWAMSISLGNLLTAVITKLVRLEGAAYFALFAALMLAAAIAFRAVSREPSEGPAAAPAPEPER